MAFPQSAFPSSLGKTPGQLQHPQPGVSNPLGLGQGGGYLQSPLAPSGLAYQPQLQNRFPGQGQQQTLQNRDFQLRFGGAMGGPSGHQGVGSAAPVPPGLGGAGLGHPSGGFGGSPGPAFGGRTQRQVLQDLWSQQQMGNQQKQLQLERQVKFAFSFLVGHVKGKAWSGNCMWGGERQKPLGQKIRE